MHLNTRFAAAMNLKFSGLFTAVDNPSGTTMQVEVGTEQLPVEDSTSQKNTCILPRLAFEGCAFHGGYW